MPRKGRPRKPGKREPNGRHQRTEPRIVKGNDRVQAMRDRFGEHYSSALGRAFVSGLLGDEQLAKDRYEAGKRFARLYARHVDQDRYRCALNDAPRGLGVVHDDLDGFAWLMRAIRDLSEPASRLYFDHLVADRYTDAGPHWLDRLIARKAHSVDKAKLQCAIDALDTIAPAPQQQRILVAISA